MRYYFLTIVLLIFTHIQAFQVLSTSPSANSLGAEANASITITFDESVDPSSISPDHISVFGRWSGPSNLEFELNGSLLTITAEESFFEGEYVMVGLNSSLQSSEGNFKTLP